MGRPTARLVHEVDDFVRVESRICVALCLNVESHGLAKMLEQSVLINDSTTSVTGTRLTHSTSAVHVTNPREATLILLVILMKSFLSRSALRSKTSIL